MEHKLEKTPGKEGARQGRLGSGRGGDSTARWSPSMSFGVIVALRKEKERTLCSGSLGSLMALFLVASRARCVDTSTTKILLGSAPRPVRMVFPDLAPTALARQFEGRFRWTARKRTRR